MIVFLVTAIIALIAGIASGLLGVGGGLILVPLFHFLLKMNMHVAIGTSLAVIVPTALISVFRNAPAQNVDWKIVLFASLFSIIGGLIGASISISLDVTLLKKIFAVFLILVALRMLIQ